MFNDNNTPETIPADNDDICIACDITEKFFAGSESFVVNIGNILHPSLIEFYTYFTFLWLVWQGLNLMIGQIDIRGLIKQLIGNLICGVLLFSFNADGGIAVRVFEVAINISTEASKLAFSAIENFGENHKFKTNPDYKYDFTQFIYVTDQVMDQIVIIATNIANQSSLFSPFMPLFASMALLATYYALYAFYTAKVAIGGFRFLFLGSITPVLIFFLGFDWGKDISKRAMQTMFASIFTLFLSTTALALVMSLAFQTLEIFMFEPNKMGYDMQEKEINIFSKDLLYGILFGLGGIAFLVEADSLASSLSGAALNSASAGVLTAGVMAGSFFAYRNMGGARAMEYAKDGARKIGPTGLANAAMGSNLMTEWDKFLNPNGKK